MTRHEKARRAIPDQISDQVRDILADMSEMTRRSILGPRLAEYPLYYRNSWRGYFAAHAAKTKIRFGELRRWTDCEIIHHKAADERRYSDAAIEDRLWAIARETWHDSYRLHTAAFDVNPDAENVEHLLSSFEYPTIADCARILEIAANINRLLNDLSRKFEPDAWAD